MPDDRSVVRMPGEGRTRVPARTSSPTSWPAQMRRMFKESDEGPRESADDRVRAHGHRTRSWVVLHDLHVQAMFTALILQDRANLFNGFDLRESDGKLVRCEKKASGETECRVVQEARKK